MKNPVSYILLAVLLFILNSTVVKAQQKFATEADLKKEASLLFENDEFDKAFPLYSQLTSIYPKDPDYNYRLGVCMIYSFEDKEKPIRFLEYASTKPEVDKEVLYYLAKAYHLNYRFDDAITKYKEYKKVASAAKATKLQVDRQIEMCKNGKLLLRNLSDLVVTDKKEMSREDFFRAYDVTGLGGKLLVKPEDKQFKTALDKKKKETSVIFSSTTTSQIFFSSYGDDASKGKDIYSIKRKDNGEWTTPQNLGAPINTEYDEDFPFLHPNGKVLYFCSKGHNSMGGYDIFKSKWNETTFTWGTPVNMDFPICTPDDDVLYVTDLNEKQAYFASARSSTTGKIEVYHINVDRKPIDLTFINGTVIKGMGEESALDLKIIVKDLNNNAIIGIYNTSPADGSYSMKLPNGGKYLFTIESAKLPTQSEVVVLPVQHEFKPIAQEISLTPKKDKLLVKTIFEGTGDDSNYTLANNFLKEKARMEVSDASAFNYGSNQNSGSSNNQTQNNNNNNSGSNNSTANNYTNPYNSQQQGSKPPKPKLSNADLLKVAKEDARDIDNAAKDAKAQANIALNYANQKNQMADSKSKEASQLLIEANKTNDVTKKQAILAQANEKNALAQQLNDETMAAFNLAKKLDLVADAKQKESALSKQYAGDLEAAVKSPNAEDAIAKLDEQSKKLEALSKENQSTNTIVASLKLDEENKTKELAKAQRAVTDAKQEISDNETVLTSLKADLAKAKKDDLKQGLTKQISELTEDNKGLEKELAQKTAKADQLEKDIDGIKNQSALVKSVVADSKTGTNEAAATSAATVDKAKLEQKVNDIAKATTQNTTSIEVAKNPNATTTTAAITPASNTVTPTTTTTTQSPVAANNTTTTNAVSPATNAANLPATTNTTSANTVTNPATTAQSPVVSNTNTTTANVPATTNNTNPATTSQSPVAANNTTNATTTNNSTTNPANTNLAAVAANNTTTNPANTTQPPVVANNTTTTNLTTNPPVSLTTSQPTAKTVESINKKYQDDLVATTKLPTEVEREQAKSDVLKSWNKAIDENIVKQKEDFKLTTDPEEKNLYAKKIADAEKVSNDLKTQTTESVAKVETLKKQPVATTNNTTNPTTTSTQAATNSTQPNTTGVQPLAVSLESITKKYQDELAVKNKITNEVEREQGKSDVLKTWNKAIDENTVKLKEQLKLTTNAEEKNGFTKKISESEKASADIKTQTTESVAKVEQLKKQQEAVANNSANNQNPGTNTNQTAVNNVAPANTTNATQPVVNKPAPTAVATATINSKFQDQLAQANKIKNEVDKEQAKLNILKNWNKAVDDNITKLNADLAATTDPQEKTVIAKTITEAQLVSKDLKTQTNESVAKVDTLKKQQEAVTANSTVPANTNSTTAANTTNNTTQPTNNNQPQTTSNNNTTTSVPPANTQPKTTTIPTAVTLAEVNKKYIAYIKSADNITNEVEREQTKTEVLKKWNKEIDNNVVKQKEELKRTNDPEEQKLYSKIIADAEKLSREIASQTKEKADKVETLKKEQNAVALNTTTTNDAVKTTSENKKNGTIANTSESVKNNKTTTTALAPTEVFEKKKVAAYSNKKPIPVDEKIPEGLVFKVQIGAFSKPIPQDLFEGIRPITGETTKEGYTRYTAGMFVKLSSAQNAKEQINGFGYKDAFVVAFLNGKRISMNEAMAMMNASPANNQTANVAANQPIINNPPSSSTVSANVPSTNQQTANTTSTNSATNNQQPVASNKQTTTTTNTTATIQQPITSNQPSSANVATTTSETASKENQPVTTNSSTNTTGTPAHIYYTIQIGVFSQALPEYKLKDIPPVTTETTPNGYLRYNSGNFASPKLADNAKATMIEAGFKDAFVTAYNNGKRISVAEARQLESQGNSVVSETTITTVTNVPNVPVTNQNQLKLTDEAKNNTAQISAKTQPSSTITTTQPATLTEQPKANTVVNPTTTSTTTQQQPVVNNTVPPVATKEELPSSIQQLTSNIQQMATNNESTTVVDSVDEPVINQSAVSTNNPVTSNPVKPVTQHPVTTNQQVPTANYTEPPATEQLPPLADSSKQNLINAIAKYNEIAVDSGVVFKVQLGVFKEQIPLNIANSYLGIAKKGIKNYKDENGYTVYILGSFKSKEDADRIKAEIEGTQLKDAFIVAFNGGKKISIEEANKLISK